MSHETSSSSVTASEKTQHTHTQATTAPRWANIIKQRLYGTLAFYLVCSFIAMMVSLFFTTTITYPLTLFFGFDVICETYVHSYKPGEIGRYYEYYMLGPNGKEAIHTLTSLAITGLFYSACAFIFVSLIDIKLLFKQQFDAATAQSTTATTNMATTKLVIGLKLALSVVPAICVLAYFYR